MKVGRRNIRNNIVIICVANLLFLSNCLAESLLLFRDTLKDGVIGPHLTVIKPGKFHMGSPPNEPERFPNESPLHFVEISTEFAISQFEITFAQYDQFAHATKRKLPSDRGWGKEYWGRGNMPVFNINWYDAEAYTLWLSDQTKQTYRLPTEAEWEYAARAGLKTPFTSGHCIGKDQANFEGNTRYADCPIAGLYRGKTVAVGQFAPNTWGVYDVHGNIFEWTMDCWHDNFVGAPTDGSAWLSADTADAEFDD